MIINLSEFTTKKLLQRSWSGIRGAFCYSLASRLTALIFAGICCVGNAGAAETNYALQYDGADDFVRVLNIGNFDFTTTFTIEAWVRAESVGSTNEWKALLSGRVDDQANGSDGGWIMYLPNSDHSRWGMSICTPGGASVLVPSSSLRLDD